MDCFVLADSESSAGVIVESMFYEWLKMRLVTELVIPSSRGLTVIELLQLQSMNCIIGDELSWMDARLDTGKEMIPTAKLTVCSYDSRESFKKEMEDIKLDSRFPLILIRPAEGEMWDLGLKFMLPGLSDSFYIFINSNSRKERLCVAAPIAKQSRKLVDFPGGGREYEATRDIMDERKFIFVYLCTLPVKSCLIDRCILQGQVDTFKLLGLFSGLCMTVTGNKSDRS